ncbi:CatB-related O-acetyltransferase [Glycomyces sp. NRRL B-16210]|uniref:CatB-related O-acetyltransferase n=1 Tax=Glycomyces sp. NRRL B-16210 TaxID=1463821 RepID=UPI0004C01AFC|nr:CatB-related O-acetyltransferase [Glycomyces sp. NRRL B-16210]
MTPDPTVLHPLPGFPRVVFLKPLITSEKIEVGDYTYYDDPDGAERFEECNVLYGYGPEKLVIGKYCAIAAGTRFLMAGGDHPMVGPSTFPFTMFGGEWAERTLDIIAGVESRGDTVVGNDVWFGCNTMVMPGVTIGDGAIIASGAVVTADVAPYTIVGGNPAQPIRKRFDKAAIEKLLKAAWWDWPVELVTEHARLIMGGSPGDLAAVAAKHGLARAR